MNIQKIGLPVALLAALIIGGLGGWWWYQAGRAETFSSKAVTFNYPVGYQKVAADSTATDHAETIVRLVNGNPLGVIELNHETGAIIGANIAKTNFLDFLESNAERALSSSYADFHKSSSKRLTIAGQAASRIDFSYEGKDKKTTLTATLLIIPKGNDAYYLYVQSSDKGLWQTTIDKIQSSIIIHS